MSSVTKCDICGFVGEADQFLTARRLDSSWGETLWARWDLCRVCIAHVRRLTKTGLCRINPCPTCGVERAETQGGSP